MLSGSGDIASGGGGTSDEMSYKNEFRHRRAVTTRCARLVLQDTPQDDLIIKAINREQIEQLYDWIEKIEPELVHFVGQTYGKITGEPPDGRRNRW
jgi:hypothetical protein